MISTYEGYMTMIWKHSAVKQSGESTDNDYDNELNRDRM